MARNPKLADGAPEAPSVRAGRFTELKYRDPKNLFGLKSEEPKRGLLRR